MEKLKSRLFTPEVVNVNPTVILVNECRVQLEEAIIENLVRSYRLGTLTQEAASFGIAEIAALRNLVKTLQG